MKVFLARDYLLSLPDNEPVFILRGRDPLAPAAVRVWADAAEVADVVSRKVREARQIAGEMEKWPEKEMPG